MATFGLTTTYDPVKPGRTVDVPGNRRPTPYDPSDPIAPDGRRVGESDTGIVPPRREPLGPRATPRTPRGDDAPDGGGGGSGGGGSTPTEPSPFDRLADAFIAGLGGGGGAQEEDTQPAFLVDPNAESGGSSMNTKTILILLAVGVAGWFVWKKWGKKALASGGNSAAA